MEEKILELLKLARNNGVSKETLYKKLGYTNLSYEEFEEIFEDMKKRHLIYQTGNNSYTKNPFYEGQTILTKKDKLLVKCEEGTFEIDKNVFNCVTGDIVRLRITDYDNKIGTITEVIERKGMSAEVITEKRKRFALMRNGDRQQIDIPQNIVDGTIIGVKIEKDRNDKNPVAILDKVIAHPFLNALSKRLIRMNTVKEEII